MRGAVQGRNTSVWGIIFKGRFVQGPQHPRTFGRGHIGRGHINPAFEYSLVWGGGWGGGGGAKKITHDTMWGAPLCAGIAREGWEHGTNNYKDTKP
jgi:hypothetical protein